MPNSHISHPSRFILLNLGYKSGWSTSPPLWLTWAQNCVAWWFFLSPSNNALCLWAFFPLSSPSCPSELNWIELRQADGILSKFWKYPFFRLKGDLKNALRRTFGSETAGILYSFYFSEFCRELFASTSFLCLPSLPTPVLPCYRYISTHG